MPQSDRAARALAAPALLFIAALAPVPAAAAPPPPEPGFDCECYLVRNPDAFQYPAGAREAVPPNAATGLSPLGRFLVTAVPGPGLYATVEVRDAATQTVLLSGLVGSSWGFSPSERWFVLAPPPSGTANSLELYDLRASPPGRAATFPLSPYGGTLLFSPRDRWLLDVQVLASQTSFTLRVLDAGTLGVVHENTLSIGSNSMPGTTASWGFSPIRERSLTYWFLGFNNTLELHLVNLHTGGHLQLTLSLGVNSFVHSYSTCEDVMAIVDAYSDLVTPANSRWDVLLYGTNDLLAHGSGAFLQSATGMPNVLTTPTQEVAVLTDGSTTPLGTNTAPAYCPDGGPPHASFSVPAGAMVGIPVAFHDTSTAGARTTLKSWDWSFGDGGVLGSNGTPTSDAVHTYARPGTYTVTLTVTDTRNFTSTSTGTVVVAPNLPPQASFAMSPASPVGRDVVTFTDTSTDDDGVAAQYWLINNGYSYSGPSVSLAACPGTIDVSLTVVDHAGQSSSVTRSVVVGPAPSHDVPVAAGADLTAAAAGACPGDRLVLAAGTYAGGVRLRDVGIAGAGAGATTISDGGSAGWVLGLTAPAGSTVTASDLTVDGGVGGILVEGAGDVVLDGLEVAHATGSGGVWVSAMSGSVAVRGSHVHHNTMDSMTVLDDPGGPGGGIGLDGPAALTVTDSEIAFNVNVSGEGAGLGARGARQVTVERTDVHDNRAFTRGGGISATLGGPTSIRLSRITRNTAATDGGAVVVDGTAVIAGCLVAGNAGGGVVDLGSPSQLALRNDTVAANGGAGLRTSLGSGADTCNTILSGNSPDLVGVLSASRTNLLGGSPGFSGDALYHLAGGSPAIDAGTNTCVPADLTADADGDARAIAAGGGAAVVDIGWDEAKAGVAPPPPAGGGGGSKGGGCGHGAAGTLSLGALLLALGLSAPRGKNAGWPGAPSRSAAARSTCPTACSGSMPGAAPRAPSSPTPTATTSAATTAPLPPPPRWRSWPTGSASRSGASGSRWATGRPSASAS